MYNAVTIVIDTLTGQVTGEHLSNTAWRIQLSDSALLDGDTAYNLADGQQRWTMKWPHGSTHNPADESTDYSGPAGHNSFILSYTENGFSKPYSDEALDGVLNIAPDTDPTKVSEMVNIAVGGRHSTPVLAGGWVAHFTEPIDVHNSEPDKNRQTHEIITSGIETEAVTLDSLPVWNRNPRWPWARRRASIPSHPGRREPSPPTRTIHPILFPFRTFTTDTTNQRWGQCSIRSPAQPLRHPTTPGSQQPRWESP